MATPKSAPTTAPSTPTPTRPKAHFDKQTVYFAIFTLAWVALSMTASQYIIAYPMSWILGSDITSPLWTCVYYALTYLLTLAFVILLPPRLFQLVREQSSKHQPKSASKTNVNPSTNLLATNATELGLQHLPTFVDIGLAPIGYIVYLFGANILLNIMTIFPWFQSDQAQEVGFGYFITTGDRILALIALVIIAPVAEEIVMRGWLYGKLRSRIKAPIAILLVSLLFGFLHGQWNVGVSVFMLSLVLCSLREITGTIWSGMLLHILSNGIAFYFLYIAL